MSNNIKAIIFDLDGTLLYTVEDLCDSVNHALKNAGLPGITVEQCTSYVGNGVRNLMEQSSGVSDNDRIDRMLADFKSYYRDHMENKTKPYDSINGMIEVFHKLGIKVAVLSNKYDEATKRLCKKLLPDTVSVVYGECADIPRKPDPAGVIKIMLELDVSPSQTAYVGDSAGDIKTAINAGVHPVGVSWGYRDAQVLRDAGAEFIADSPVDIILYALS